MSGNSTYKRITGNSPLINAIRYRRMSLCVKTHFHAFNGDVRQSVDCDIDQNDRLCAVYGVNIDAWWDDSTVVDDFTEKVEVK